MDDTDKTSNRLLDYREAASVLGIAPTTLRRWVMLRKIGHKKLGRIVRFDPRELREWIDERSVHVTKEGAGG